MFKDKLEDFLWDVLQDKKNLDSPILDENTNESKGEVSVFTNPSKLLQHVLLDEFEGNS